MVHFLALCASTGLRTQTSFTRSTWHHLFYLSKSHLLLYAETSMDSSVPLRLYNGESVYRELLGKKHHLTVAWDSLNSQIGPHP